MATDPKKHISDVTATVSARHYDPNGIEGAENSQYAMDPDIILTMVIPDYTIQIFNVGPMEFIVQKGSAGPPGGFVIRACGKDESFSEPTRIASRIADTFMDPLTGLIKAHWMRGEDMARDIVHPVNGRMWSVGQNLDDFGVFWTKNEEPTKKELEEATTKMEVTFRSALAEANMLEATNRLDLITPLMRHAASYFEEDREWNRAYKRVLECPACGQSMKAGIAVHSCGAVLDWPKAIFHGVRTFQHAKDAEMYSEQLVKQVADLRENKKRADELAAQVVDERSIAQNDGGSFLTASEITEHEEENAAERGQAPRKSVFPNLAEQPGQPATAAGKRTRPPAPKRPSNFREK